MTVKAEEVLQAIVAAIEAVDGTGEYSTDLRGRVFQEDTAVVPDWTVTPVVTVGFSGISPGEGLRERTIAIEIDAFIDLAYAASVGIKPQEAILRIEHDIQHAVRAGADVIAKAVYTGTNRHRVQEGTTDNGVTISFGLTYTETELR